MFATPRRTIALAAFSLALASSTTIGPPALAQEGEPVRVPPPSGRLASLGLSSTAPAPGGEAASRAPSSGGWWLGTSGIALALAACGAASVAARRYRPSATSAMVNVVGKVSLSPRHSIVLVRAGSRVLLVGTGPQGAPSLLGELEADAASLAAIGPPRAGGDE